MCIFDGAYLCKLVFLRVVHFHCIYWCLNVFICVCVFCLCADLWVPMCFCVGVSVQICVSFFCLNFPLNCYCSSLRFYFCVLSVFNARVTVSRSYFIFFMFLVTRILCAIGPLFRASEFEFRLRPLHSLTHYKHWKRYESLYTPFTSYARQTGISRCGWWLVYEKELWI